MQVLRDESPELKSTKSEIIIAREMGELFSYASEEIDSYIKQMNDRLSQIKARMPVT
ncbi:hypothetical protein JRA98_004946 [Escherichia coli O28ac]|uniref:T3SS effector protein NleE n=2 Tax=Enterobacteriaceae TaxID=543 RepID=A0AAN3TAT5_ECOLX|nr:T3SS effector protein NleE [Escherichia coli]EHD3370778.1 hypothetical protein [Escherichia coli O28ac]EHD3468593.1 hypothetical protein [Escherichia coli O124]EJF4022106.1 hypothetical protein [Shigella dysenteriae]EAA1050549.1 T3SS effector protein NleE [Escherichia coli]EFB2214966.1 hypothetical protein [Escherichia coli]